jgi:hypothetical protein
MPPKRYEPSAPRTLQAATGDRDRDARAERAGTMPAMLDDAHPDAGALAAQLASVRVGDVTDAACAAHHSPVAGRAPCTGTFEE